MRYMPSKVVAAIPCFNTGATIADVVARTRGYVDAVIVVDDGSSDRTAQIARDSGAIVVSHGKNLGKGAAMRSAVLSTDADLVVFLDGDGQHNPAEIPAVIAPIVQGKADLVIGSRYLPRSRASAPPFARRATNAVASLTISIVIAWILPVSLALNRVFVRSHKASAEPPSSPKRPKGRKWLTDCTSGFRAIRKRDWEKLELLSPGFEIEAEMIYEAARNKLVMAEVPVSCHWNGQFSNLSIIRDGLRTLRLLAAKLAGDIGRRPKTSVQANRA